MDSQLVQRTRYQLQARVRTAKTCPVALFPMSCSHLLEWIDNHPLLRALIAPLAEAATQYEARINADLTKIGTKALGEVNGPWHTPTRVDAAALAWATLCVIRTIDVTDRRDRRAYIVALVTSGYEPENGPQASEIVDVLRDVSVEALYEYLDEGIDSRNAVLGLLVKYRQRCEMYRRLRLRAAAVGGMEGRSGERALAFDLYEYIHDQGVDFSIESVSASGEPDLVSRDVRGECLVADAKYIDDPAKARRSVVGGFRQVLDYCRDHNESVGYLVVFVNCDVVLDLKADRDDGFPCFRTGGYTVYYVIIDIHEHAATASKRAKPSVLELTHEALVNAVQEPDGGAA